MKRNGTGDDFLFFLYALPFFPYAFSFGNQSFAELSTVKHPMLV